MMKIVVNDELCEANAVCVQRAPEVFEIDDDGRMHLLLTRPAPELLAKVQQAIDRCPRAALALVEGDA